MYTGLLCRNAFLKNVTFVAGVGLPLKLNNLRKRVQFLPYFEALPGQHWNQLFSPLSCNLSFPRGRFFPQTRFSLFVPPFSLSAGEVVGQAKI